MSEWTLLLKMFQLESVFAPLKSENALLFIDISNVWFFILKLNVIYSLAKWNSGADFSAATNIKTPKPLSRMQ